MNARPNLRTAFHEDFKVMVDVAVDVAVQDAGTGPKSRLRWRDPLILQLTDQDDLDALLLHEGRLVQARERDKCLSELKAHLQTQKFNRDRVRTAAKAATRYRDANLRRTDHVGDPAERFTPCVGQADPRGAPLVLGGREHGAKVDAG